MTPKVRSEMMIRSATMADVPEIHRLISFHAELNRMLFRSLTELYENLRDFSVCVGAGEIVGCAALELVWRDLAEIKSLAVHEDARGQGIGQNLVRSLVAEAKALQLSQVFALTREEPFFSKLGFSTVPKETLPHKVWTDCVKCPVQDNCDEVAVVLSLVTE